MATVNLLKASFNGKLGEIYGTKQYGNVYAKAIPFSHAPHSKTQTKCVRAFEKLNRLASGIASIAFPFLNLSDKKMLKHNAAAQWLKPLIANKTFQPEKIADIIEPGNETEITNLKINLQTNSITVSAKTRKEVSIIKKKRWFLFVFDDFGQMLLAEAPKEDFFATTITTTLSADRSYYAMAFRSDFSVNKFLLGGLSITVPLVVQNGILYTSRLGDSDKFTVENGVLKYSGSLYKIKNNLFVIN